MLASCLHTYATWQRVAPDTPASSQTRDLTVALQSVSMETGKDERVADLKPEAHPPAERRNPRIFAGFQVVFWRGRKQALDGMLKHLQIYQFFRNEYGYT